MSESLRGLAMATAAIVVVLDAPLALLVAMAALSSIAGTVSMPAQGTLLPELARDDEELALANSADATIEGVASIAGPAVAGVLLVVGGVALAFALNAATFALVVFAVVRYGMRSHAGTCDGLVPSDEGPEGRERGVGCRRRGAHDRCAAPHGPGPLALDAAVSLIAGALTVHPGRDRRRRSLRRRVGVGALAVASGVGALVGGVGSAAFAVRSRTGMILGITTASVAVLAMGGGSLPLTMSAMAVCAGALVLLDTLGRTWVQRITASGGTGRAFGLINTLAAIWMLVGSVGSAVLIPWLGLGPVLAAGATVITLAGLVAVVPWPVLGIKHEQAAAAGHA